MWTQLVPMIWGCVPELTQNCQDMTNASSAYLGIAVGSVIGGLISWLIYSRQAHTSVMQNHTLEQIRALSDHQEKILKRLDDSDKRHDRMLKTILEIDKRINTIIGNRESRRDSVETSD